ncbi:ATP-binding protein [bacterium]|nr:ATP-binding protein [bacterium]MCI0602168.1 ATP-binding protein [bacterium]
MRGGRSNYGLPANFYHWLTGIIGFILVIFFSIRSPFPAQPTPLHVFSLFLMMHVIASFLNFQYARMNVVITFGSSFITAALLVFGAVPAILVAVSGIVIGSVKRMIERHWILRKKIPLSYELGIVVFNSGMIGLMWLTASWIYIYLLQSELPLIHLTVRNILCIILMFLGLSLLNGVLLFFSNYLRNQQRPIEYVRKGLIPAFFTEFAAIPFGVVMALSYNRMGILAFLVLSSTLLIGNIVLRRLSSIRYDLEDKLRHLTSLNRVSRQIITLRDQDAVMNLLFEELSLVTETDCWFIAEVDKWRSVNLLKGKEPQKESFIKLAAHVVRSRQPLWISNTQKDAPEELKQSLLQDDIHSCIASPLVVADKIHGVVSVYSDEASAFKHELMQVLVMIADETALALENAKLYDVLTEKVNELERLNTELRQVDTLKSVFLANVSHELRTPLTSIKGYVEYIKKEKLGPLTAMQSEGLSVAQRNILRLQRLINDLLDYTKLESKKAPIQLRPCRLENIWADVYEQYADLIEKRNLEVQVRIPLDLPVLFVDIQRFTQVLTNLLSNAIKFTGDQGRIRIAAQVIHHPGPFYHFETYTSNCIVEALTPVEITVSDDGIGIPADALPRIFDRFYQVDSSHTRKYGGTGLGLALVKSILDAHGIPIEVQSKIGFGTTFGMVVPSLQAADLPAAVKPNKPETVSSPKYLT